MIFIVNLVSFFKGVVGGEVGIGSLASHLSTRYGTDLDLSDAGFQQNLEYIKEQIKKDIRKELKLKEGAENMRKVTTDKKSIANINNMVNALLTALTILSMSPTY